MNPEPTPPTSSPAPPRRRTFALALGPAVAVVMLLLPAPEGLDVVGWRTAAAALWMALWWITEALPIPVTALLPLVAFPFLGILPMSDAAAPYANEIIFLFMGGFFLAAAMESSGLHRRIALTIIHRVGLGPERLVLGFMLATAFLSMWISNTATAAMMLPIGIAVVELFRREGPREGFPLGVALMLGIAYGASIGGVATLIGTPPNAIFAAAVSELLGGQIGFGRWMLLGLPVTAVMLPLTWLILVKVLHPPGELGGDARGILEEQLARLGPASAAERRVGIVFSATALAWILRAPKTLGGVTVPGLQDLAPGIRDSTIAMAAALVLFVLPRGAPRSSADARSTPTEPSGSNPGPDIGPGPSDESGDADPSGGTPILTWARARRIPWGVLILFGGGLSLARAMETSGLSRWIGASVAGLEGVHTLVLFGALALLFVFLTELTSNAATTTMAMPVLVGAAAAMGQAPLPFMIVATLSSSMAFMLPVATPPNAIVFGSDYLTIPQMARAGIVLNLVAVCVVTLAGWLLLPLVFPG